MRTTLKEEKCFLGANYFLLAWTPFDLGGVNIFEINASLPSVWNPLKIEPLHPKKRLKRI